MCTIEEKCNARFCILRKAVQDLKISINRYVNSFSQSDFFTFSGGEERKRQYNEAYKQLSLKMPLLVADIEQVCAQLAGLLIDADREADEELSAQLNETFIAHEAFEERFAEFVETTECELSARVPSPTALSNAAGRLLSAVDRLGK